MRVALETDTAIKNRIANRFSVLEEMTYNCANGAINGLIVYGAPGVGKSFGIERVLELVSLQDRVGWNPRSPNQNPRRIQYSIETGEPSFRPRYKVVKGHITAAGLFKTLYEYRDEREVLVFDDCDSVLNDVESLELLKAALDSSQTRKISWVKNRQVDRIPQTFEFKGSVIFITNVDFRELADGRKTKLTVHLQAMLSRCFYLDLTITTAREKMLRIEQVLCEGNVLSQQGYSNEQINDIMNFVKKHCENFKELSVRKALQVASLCKISNSDNWQNIAEMTLV